MCRKCGDNPGRDPPYLYASAGAFKIHFQTTPWKLIVLTSSPPPYQRPDQSPETCDWLSQYAKPT